jgi:hypothetical protein
VVSFYAKAKEVTSITLRLGVSSIWAGGIRPVAACNLINGSITLTSGAATVSSQNIGNGWYRFTIITAAAVSTGGTNIQSLTGAVLSPTSGDGFYLWGVQWEQNAAYPTTYIPTTTAAVTRLADACSVTGVADLIGQTEGTLFAEFAVPLNESITRSLVLSSSTVANRAAISTFAGSVFARVDVGGVNQVNSNATMTVTNMNKVAFRYKENDFAVYVNGVKVITDTSGITFPAGTLDRFAFIQPDSTSAFNGTVSKIAFYNTGLIDSQLQSLTTL